MARSTKRVATRFGEIAYEERGEGPPALFLHGVFLNGHLWRHVIDEVAGQRRCFALDLLGHGETRTPPEADLSFDAQAGMIAAFADALGLGRIDLVGNDSGGGIAQIFAASFPERVRSLTLTNCDTHDNWPPPTFLPFIEAVAAGRLRELGPAVLADPAAGRELLGVGYEHPERVSDETVRTYLDPIFASADRIALLERWCPAMDNRQTVAAEASLRRLAAPTLIVWGTGDPFFDVAWARWLYEAIPGARPPVVLEGAKLFFPEERPEPLAAALRSLWAEAAVPA